MVTPERWLRIRSAFEHVRDADASVRSSLLAEYCDGDAELMDVVGRMLACDADDDRLLSLCESLDPDELMAEISEFAATAPSMDRYHIVARLGEGGMGVVYEAERADGAFEMRVAIKVLREGMDSAHFQRRFDAERAALARLDHPNIARLLDAGTTADGRPFIAMELVAGEPVHKHCDRLGLDVRGRVRMLLQVCDAVAHAHRNLVLHRDIKPSNIIVTRDGVAKLLDFGIAKALAPDDAADRTMTIERLLTPRYASPEHVAGEALTTASDVYSLGVVLYELLTGLEPYEVSSRTPYAYERAIREQTPMPPSVAVVRRACPSERPRQAANAAALRRSLRGDLDVIVMRALAKDVGRRYESAEALARDLRAYLDQRPVSARRDSISYRTGKLIRRAPAQTALGAVSLASIVGLGLYSMIQRGHAERSADEAVARVIELEQQKAITDAINTFYTDEVLGFANPERSRAVDVTIGEALERAAAGIEQRFADAPLVEAKIRHALGYYYHQRSEYEKAEPHLDRAWRLRDEILGAEHLDSLLSKRDYANCLNWMRRLDEALVIFEEVLAIQRRIWPDDGQTIMTISLIGATLIDLDRYDEGAALMHEAYEWRRKTWGERNGNTLTSMNNLAALYARLGRYSDARPLMQRAMELRIEEYGMKHPRTLIARANFARVIEGMGEREQAIAMLEAVRADQLEVLGESHAHTAHVQNMLESLRGRP